METKENIITEDLVTLREVLKETLNNSYEGHNEGCLNCAEINEVVDHFVQQGFFKIYVVKSYDCYTETFLNFCGYFARKEFAEEKVKELEKKNEDDKNFSFFYKIDEIDVTI